MKNKISIPKYVLSALKELKYEIKIEGNEEGEDNIIYIEDFSAYETENPVFVRGIIENPHPVNKTWMIQGTKYYPATRWEPEEIDLFDIKEVDSVVIAIREILYMLEKRKVDMILESSGMEEFAKEQEEMEKYMETY